MKTKRLNKLYRIEDTLLYGLIGDTPPVYSDSWRNKLAIIQEKIKNLKYY